MRSTLGYFPGHELRADTEPYFAESTVDNGVCSSYAWHVVHQGAYGNTEVLTALSGTL